jgi:PHD/YefM family antitoxin component YafN of YafNO toxin-antitoxin module
MRRAQDTYSLRHFRQRTGEHLERLAEGRVETLTQNGEAAMVVMSPKTYDAMRIELERGHIWDQAIEEIEAGDRGLAAEETFEQIAAELNLKR